MMRKKSRRQKTHCLVSPDRFSISKMRSRDLLSLLDVFSCHFIGSLKGKRNCWFKAHEMLNFQVVGLSM